MNTRHNYRLTYVNFYPQPAMKSTPAPFSKLSVGWKLVFIALYMCIAATGIMTIQFVWYMFFKLVGLA